VGSRDPSAPPNLDYVIPQTHFSDRFSGTSHVLIVLLVAAIAAVFPVSIAAHSAASQTAAPVAVSHVEISAKRLPVSTPVLHSVPKVATVGTTKVATKVATKSAPPAHVAIRKQVVATVPPVVKAAAVVQNVAPSQPTGYGCGSALAYLQKHAAPGFSFECPGYAEGHQAMTCINMAGVCPGIKLIAISIPCAAAYMNEASNSWVLTGKSNAPIDPYGYCPE
jgi:hypothetical protein